jgi:hypothetical protein
LEVVLSGNKRNIDTDELSKPSQGNALPTGTGAHAQHRREEEVETADNKEKGRAGRKAGEGKGYTRPE